MREPSHISEASSSGQSFWCILSGRWRRLNRVWDAVVSLHSLLSWMLLVVATTHALAALWHHFWRRDDVLRRMIRSGLASIDPYVFDAAQSDHSGSALDLPPVSTFKQTEG